MNTLVHDSFLDGASTVPTEVPLGVPPEVPRAPARERWSWALHDFASTLFSMNVITLYFAVWLVSDLHASNTTVAIANGITSVLVVISLPIFGALSDVTRRRKPWVVGFTLLCAAATILIGVFGNTLLPLVGDSVIGGRIDPTFHISGFPLVAIMGAFVVANYAHQGAVPFYNAMMPELVPRSEWGRLSGLGAALAYVGSITGVLMITPFFNGALPVFGALPHSFIDTLRSIFPYTQHAGRVSTFVPTGIVFLIFALPLIILCRDHFPVASGHGVLWRKAFRDVAQTFADTKKYPGTRRFILASFVYQDAMGTIISYMALYAVVAMGFERGAEATLFVILTVPAVFGSWLWGRMTDKIGPKKTLLFIIGAWIVLLIAMMLVSSQSLFWVVGAGIGFIYGGVSVAERPLLLTLVPEAEGGRFFSLMILSARAAAVAGPFIWGFAVDGLTPIVGKYFAYRAAVGTVAVAMIIALFVLRGVPERTPLATTDRQ
jgi:MFS transporter, UMF1 family